MAHQFHDQFGGPTGGISMQSEISQTRFHAQRNWTKTNSPVQKLLSVQFGV
jgi:hypothetical protein